ncbi:MAG: hypothetical protein ACLGIF_00670 [Actinomycetes bacterium]
MTRTPGSGPHPAVGPAAPRALRPIATGTALLLALGALAPTAAAAEVAFILSDSRITESSGLARDPRRDRFWTVNDSGDAAAYALRSDGDVLGALRFRATPIDVEAVAVSGDRLYLADIGDNQKRRQFVTVYYFDDPRPGQTVPYQAYDFAYPDGPHDAETLLVDPTGRLYVVTKESRASIYAAPGRPSRQGVNRLIRVGDAPAYVTDGLFLPDRDRIALRTYVSVLILDATSYATVARAPAPPQPQGESLAVSLDGRSLLLGSEGRDSKVYAVPVPDTKADVPPAPASAPGGAPSPSPNPRPSPTPQPVGQETAVPAGGRQGTLLALAVAGFVALVAGVVVAGRRR